MANREYPYPEAQVLIEDMKRNSARKIVWGSDMPNVERFCTYLQSVDYVRRHCKFLKGSEKDDILGGKIDKLLVSGARRAGEHQAAE